MISIITKFSMVQPDSQPLTRFTASQTNRHLEYSASSKMWLSNHILTLIIFCICCSYFFHACNTTNHNWNLHTRFLTALSQYQLVLSGHFLVDITGITPPNHAVLWLAQQQATSAFHKTLHVHVADQICQWAHKISRLESCFSCKIAKHPCRWAAQQKSYSAVHSISSHRQKNRVAPGGK